MNLRSIHRPQGFTLVEMLTVITVILILAAILLNVAGYVNNKAASSRAESEIHAMSVALESYKADNGTYPQDANSDALNANGAAKQAINYDPTAYAAAGQLLYRALSGDNDNNPTNAASGTGKQYMEVKPNMLGGGTSAYMQDPFGNAYGYSTAYQADLAKTPPVDPPTHGFNPTFDLWSTAGGKTAVEYPKWIKNW